MFKSKNLPNGDVNYAFFLLYIISKNQSNYVYNLEKYTTFFQKNIECDIGENFVNVWKCERSYHWPSDHVFKKCRIFS